MQRERVRILGISIDRVTMRDAVARALDFAASGTFHQIVTVNPEFIMTARRNAAFAAVLNTADLAVPDGIGLIWAARWRRQPLPERVAGVDMVERIAAAAAKSGLRIYLLGAQPGVADDAARVLQSRYPALLVAGSHAGTPHPEDDAAQVERINASAAHILLVAYGAPQQELWIARNRARLAAGVSMGVGGAFDFIAGRSRRAPHWMQRLGLEWFYRLVREPWRWRRMLALPRFAWAVITEHRT